MIQEVTAAGIEAMARVLSSGGKVEFTRCAVGSGTFNPQTMDAKSMTQMINQTASKAVTAVRVESGGVAVVADMENTIIPGGTKIAEMGVFATAGGGEFLFAYAYTPTPETVPQKEQSTYERRFVTHVAMSDDEIALTVTFNTVEDAMAGLAEVARTGDYDDLANKPTVDSALSDTSTNAVQNKVVKSALDEKQAEHKTATATLAAAAWSNLSQQVAVAGVTASSTVIVSPDPASAEAWGKAGVRAAAQDAGKVTFACRKVPATALTANIAIFS